MMGFGTPISGTFDWSVDGGSLALGFTAIPHQQGSAHIEMRPEEYVKLRTDNKFLYKIVRVRVKFTADAGDPPSMCDAVLEIGFSYLPEF